MRLPSIEVMFRSGCDKGTFAAFSGRPCILPFIDRKILFNIPTHSHDQELFLHVAWLKNESAGNIRREGRDPRQFEQRRDRQYGPRPIDIPLICENLSGDTQSASNREEQEPSKHQAGTPQ